MATSADARDRQEICCCLGLPLAGNPTQYLMERAFARRQLDWRYLTLEVTPENLADAVRGVKALGFRGGNIASPHKAAVMEHLDRVTDNADLIGAVNCIFRDEEGRLVGVNTEGEAFLQCLQTAMDPEGKRVVILGAGGAAYAVAAALASAKVAELTVFNRDPQRGAELAERLRERSGLTATSAVWEGEAVLPEGTDILINATSVGMFEPDARLALDVSTLRRETLVADLTYNPGDTRLLTDARALGCPTLDGLGTLINQAARSFTLWTGIEPDPDVMRDALEEFLGI